MDRSHDLELLRQTAKDAAACALAFFGRSLAVERKADGTVVTEADRAVDDLLSARLKAARPDYGWLSEESFERNAVHDAPKTFILDPIDGTRAFLEGRDDWTVALSLVEKGAPILAVVVNPLRSEVYEAQAGRGASLNGRKITASKRKALDGAQVAVSAVGTTGWSGRAVLSKLSPLFVHSSIYRLALVACGRADLSFALKPKWVWDVAPGALLVSEAEGIISDVMGKPLIFNSAEAKIQGFLAAGPNLHQMLAACLSAVSDGSPAQKRREV